MKKWYALILAMLLLIVMPCSAAKQEPATALQFCSAEAVYGISAIYDIIDSDNVTDVSVTFVDAVKAYAYANYTNNEVRVIVAATEALDLTEAIGWVTAKLGDETVIAPQLKVKSLKFNGKKVDYLVCTDSDRNHACDVCGAPIGEHEAVAGNHTCDYCGQTVTECVDSETDHACDICGTPVSVCADGDSDHNCDVCGAPMGEHKAAEGKHTCDYCNEKVTECVDEGYDHECDVCGAVMGVHEAAGGKHTCDYCGETVSLCADKDSDHDCDICGTVMSVHEAAGGKHTCDYCGKTVSLCADKDSDHACDMCGAQMDEHKAAEGKHTCDYCNEKVTDCADEGHDHTCDVCGVQMGEHEAAEGKHTCDYCNEKVTDCVDEGRDHACDVCGAQTSEHKAAEGKHTCDYCNQKVTCCVDEGRDHKCDVCGAPMGVHAAAEGKHTCDYCGQIINTCADENNDNLCDVCGSNMGKTYTVTFIVTDGFPAPDAQTVNHGSYVVKPDEPTRENYAFAGWAIDAEGNQFWDFDKDKVTKEVTLYAQWKQHQWEAEEYVWHADGCTAIQACVNCDEKKESPVSFHLTEKTFTMSHVPDNLKILIVGYTSNDQMVGCQIESPAKTINLAISGNAANIAYIRVFFLNADWEPLCIPMR